MSDDDIPYEAPRSFGDDHDAAHAERARNAAWHAEMREQGCRVKIFSATLDGLTCSLCAAWDGVYLAIDDDRVEIPLEGCGCDEGCRCCWMWGSEDISEVRSVRVAPW